jgi:hypothetical protein
MYIINITINTGPLVVKNNIGQSLSANTLTLVGKNNIGTS